MDIFRIYRNFWNFCFENPEKIKPTHIAIFSFAVEHCNRLGWKQKFGFPTSMVLEATGIKSYSVFKKHFDDLIEFELIDILEYSKNQYSSNIIALKENTKAYNKADTKSLDNAFIKHTSKQSESTCESNSTIIKQITNNQLTIKQENRKIKFSPPSSLEVENYVLEKKYKVNAISFWNFYESKDWMVGKNKMKDWKKAIAGWESRNNENNHGNTNQQQASNTKKPYVFSVDRAIETITSRSERRLP